MEWLVIADDLTGACDTGGAFASGGLKTRVLLNWNGTAAPVQVLVVTSESRHLQAAEAAQAVKETLSTIDRPGDCKVYKKIDSTLRGQPAIELAAAMEACQTDRALVCPAFPGQGRTVRGGRLYVHGKPLEKTVFGAEISQGKTIDLAHWFESDLGSRLLPLALVHQGVEAVAAVLSSQRGIVFVADSESESDLEILARAADAAELKLVCGSAGLARAINRAGGGSGEKAHRITGAPVLVAAGSRHPTTVHQVAELERQGCAVIALPDSDIRVANEDDRLVALASRFMLDRKDVVLSTTQMDYRPGEEAEIAQGLGRLAARALMETGAGGVVLTGGDTAAAVCQSLGCQAIDLGGEVLPGMVWGWLAGGSKPGLPVITKAGGFGDDQALMKAVHFFRPGMYERNIPNKFDKT